RGGHSLEAFDPSRRQIGSWPIRRWPFYGRFRARTRFLRKNTCWQQAKRRRQNRDSGLAEPPHELGFLFSPLPLSLPRFKSYGCAVSCTGNSESASKLVSTS